MREFKDEDWVFWNHGIGNPSRFSVNFVEKKVRFGTKFKSDFRFKLCGNGTRTRAVLSHGEPVWKDKLDMERGKQPAFIYDSKLLCTTVHFIFQHVLDLGLRPTNQNHPV